MKLFIVTGLPGTGKTKYCEGQMTYGKLTYDMDAIADAMDFAKKSGLARVVAMRMLETFLVNCKKEKADEVYVIRTSPSIEEEHMFAKYKPEYIELNQIWTRRDFNDDDWNRIILKHELYVRRIKPKIVTEERW